MYARDILLASEKEETPLKFEDFKKVVVSKYSLKEFNANTLSINLLVRSTCASHSTPFAGWILFIIVAQRYGGDSATPFCGSHETWSLWWQYRVIAGGGLVISSCCQRFAQRTQET